MEEHILSGDRNQIPYLSEAAAAAAAAAADERILSGGAESGNGTPRSLSISLLFSVLSLQWPMAGAGCGSAQHVVNCPGHGELRCLPIVNVGVDPPLRYAILGAHPPPALPAYTDPLPSSGRARRHSVRCASLLICIDLYIYVRSSSIKLTHSILACGSSC